jgi:hypothetical protein
VCDVVGVGAIGILGVYFESAISLIKVCPGLPLPVGHIGAVVLTSWTIGTVARFEMITRAKHDYWATRVLGVLVAVGAIDRESVCSIANEQRAPLVAT